ncbi:carbohydrate binding family 9 domain-containing protein [candidate division KSB1 bacterium]|nr:carbohydrate binding family 9 domain-containing protein [candidate division KSB1 bacterium]
MPEKRKRNILFMQQYGRLALLHAFLLSTGFALHAQQNEPNLIAAHHIQGNIQIDGNLIEAEWQVAQHISNFTQRELSEGQPVTEKTEVAILYNESTLYLGVRCFDREPKKLTAKKMQRDFDFDTEDNFEIIIDTYNDKRNGYLFVTNPNGALADALVLDNGRQVNEDWDGVWNVATKITGEGWFAELEIPFSTLKFSSADEQIWGINFERNIRRKLEQVLWQGWSRDSELEQVSRAGTLVGIKGISSVRLLEIKPYVLGGAEKPSASSTNRVGDLGGEVNYLITPTLKLNLTANSDFAQVESDREQINLTRFSLFFPEKREFFLDGRDYFDFSLGDRIQPFYSRRIGLSDDRREVPIIGGARILGKLRNTTLGGMIMQTAEKDNLPTTNYSVLRWKQDILQQSTIGVISTTRADADHLNATYGFDFLYSTSQFWGNKNLHFGGAYAQSYTSNRDAQTGSAHRLFISIPTNYVEFDAAWNRSGTNFDPEVGFLRRKNFQEFYAELQFNPRPKFLPFLRKMEFKPLDVNYFIDDATGELTTFFSEFRPLGFATKSGEFFEFNLQRLAERLIDDFEIHEGVIIPPAEYWFTRYEIQFSTFGGRRIAGEGSASWGDFYDGTNTEWGASLVWRTSKHLSLGADYQHNEVKLPTGAFRTHEVGGRADFAFSPKLFGSLFGQWNNDDDEMLLNFRINWIPKPGTDFFLVINQAVDTQASGWRANNTTLLSKFVWRFVL